MAETNRVWVRTTALDTAIYGKSKSTNQRSIPGASFDDTSSSHHWGWAKGRIISDPGDKSHLAGEQLEYTEKDEIKVYIQDADSAHDRNEVTLMGSAVHSGDLVMDNVYGDDHGIDSDEDDESMNDEYFSDEEGGNGASDKYPDDLIILTHLHEPSVVYCLRKRYARDKIYTSTGPMLIALNPFKHCTELYSEKMMKKYWDRGENRMLGIAGESSSNSDENDPASGEGNILPPHVYGIADDSFRKMMAKLEESSSNNSSSGGRRRRPATASSSSSTLALSTCNQSILVSGESGAGKTVTTKFIMQYLATLSKRSADPGEGEVVKAQSTGPGEKEKVDIEQQVLHSNPILESFGNARTIRNDNSSRFGKFIEIQFTDMGHLAGANIETYLLEKVRLISQTEGERNYHIFYELLEGLPDEDLDRYYLTDYGVEDFLMTNQSGTYDRRDGVRDDDTFQDLLVAMETMDFSKEEQTNILTITCALLHSSNLTLNSVTADESEIDRENKHLEAFLSLMGLTADDLNRALCYFSITAGREKHVRSNSKEKAEKGLLALIKATYGALFTHVVKRVNDSIATFHSKKSRDDHTAAAASIGVLDIFGFESFQTNSFEQLCINYCNEALQQQFNLFVLKNEQDEYEREGIAWSYVTFPDNQDVLDLISKKGAGILSILDDQCRAPGTTDKTFINDLYQKVSRHKRFEADYRQVGARKFAIIHYAGTVEYESEGFVEKNRDELPKEATELLLSSSNKFVKSLAEIISGDSASAAKDTKRSPAARPGPKSKSTVGGQFSIQLQELRQKIDLTTPHYIRCLKPNDELEPDSFNPLVVADQLRCAGVIEAVRVSRLGYPQRYQHSRFVARYRILGIRALKKANASSKKRKPVEVLVDAIVDKITEYTGDSDAGQKDLTAIGIQVGKTKVFLRRNAYETIERLRNLEMRKAAITIQSIARCYVARRGLVEAKDAITTLQCFSRTNAARRLIDEVRREHNSITMQKYFRRFSATKRFQNTVCLCKSLQRLHRGVVGRRLFRALNNNRKATKIQQTWRMCKLHRNFKNCRAAAVTVQCKVRCITAKKRMGTYKIAARDLQNTASERDQFRDENKRLGKALADALSKIAEVDSVLMNNPLEKELATRDAELVTMRQEVETAKTTCTRERKRAEQAENSLGDRELERQELSKIQAQVSQLEELCQLKEEENSQHCNDFDALKEELKVVMSTNADLEESKTALTAEMQTIRDDREVLTRELENARTESDGFRKESEALQQNADCASKEFASLNASSHGEITELEQRINKSNEDLEAVRSEKRDLEQNLQVSTDKLAASKAEIVHLQKAVEAESGGKEATRADNERLTTQQLETQMTGEAEKYRLEVDIAKKEHEIAQLRKESDVANGSIKMRLNEISTLEHGLTEAKHEISHLNQMLENKKENSQSSSEEITTLQAENEGLKKKVETQSNAIDTLRTIQVEKEQLEVEIVNLQQELSTSSVDKGVIESLREKLEKITSQVQSISAERDSLVEELKTVRKDIHDSEVSATHLKENLDLHAINAASIKADNDVLKEQISKQERDFATMAGIMAEKEELAATVASLQKDLENATSSEKLNTALLDQHRMQTLESKASKEIDIILHPDHEKHQVLSTASMYSLDGSETTREGDDKDTEIANLKDIIETLKTELKAAPDATSSDGDDPSQFRHELGKESSAEEILTLQDEVERLNQEISSMKIDDQGSNQSSFHQSRQGDSHQASKLIDSIMAKDEEIRDLRREIAILRDQLDSTTVSLLTESQSHIYSKVPDDDERSVMSKFFGRGPHRPYPGAENKDMVHLKSMNESLQSKLEEVKDERDDLESTLNTEREKAEMELACFAEALKGVDELRRAAEQMSREITRLKNQKDDEVPDDPFDDINNDAIEEYESKVENFESVKRTMGTATVTFPKPERKGLWGKLRSGSVAHRSRRRGNEDDDDSANGSIFSSFF